MCLGESTRLPFQSVPLTYFYALQFLIKRKILLQYALKVLFDSSVSQDKLVVLPVMPL